MINRNHENITLRSKWSAKLGITDITTEEWQCFNIICFKTIKDNKFIWFQYRLLNRILGTKEYISKLKISEDPYCNFCNYCIEDIIHLFWECNAVQLFWNSLMAWLKTISPINLTLDKRKVLFGFIENSNLAFNKNFILIIAKFFIFKCSKEKRHLNNIEFQSFFLKIYNEQLYLARANCQFEKFSRVWSMFTF